MTAYLLIFAGGGLGAMARYWVGLRAAEWLGSWLPWGTLAVNAAGCLAVGVLGALVIERGMFSPDERRFLMTGILGGFTTFSAFSLETRLLFREGDPGLGLLYVGLTLALCLAGAWAGWALGARWS